VRTERWTDSSAVSGREVALAIYYHPDHDRNLDAFVRNLKASLANLTTHLDVGPYEGSDLRIVEVPRYHREIRVHPNLVAFSEGRFIAHLTEGKIDPLFFGTVREFAQQGWGGQVSGTPNVRGREDSSGDRLRTTAP
jgi:ABC-2 type transport system permease protein